MGGWGGWGPDGALSFSFSVNFIERDMQHGSGCARAGFDCTHVSDDQDCGQGNLICGDNGRCRAGESKDAKAAL